MDEMSRGEKGEKGEKSGGRHFILASWNHSHKTNTNYSFLLCGCDNLRYKTDSSTKLKITKTPIFWQTKLRS